MAKRWTHGEDAFLITYSGVDVDFIASHDLGRPDGAGSRRWKQLLKSGAVEEFANMQISRLHFDRLAGRCGWDDEAEFAKWRAIFKQGVERSDNQPRNESEVFD